MTGAQKEGERRKEEVERWRGGEEASVMDSPVEFH